MKGKKTGGRVKGVPNKLTRDLREMILAALDRVGGEAYLVRRARDNPVAFLVLLGKVLPLNVQANVAGALSFADTIKAARERARTHLGQQQAEGKARLAERAASGNRK